MFEWLFKPASRARSPASTRAAADQLVSQGNRAEREGRLREACELYRRAVDAAPAYARAHLNLGIGLEAVGEADAALAAYEAALAIDPADPYVNYNLGRLLQARGALQRGERLLREALQGKADFPEARIVLACVLQAQDRLEAAAAELEAALKLRPDDFGALYQHARVLRKLNKPVQAQDALKRALTIDPGNADASHEFATLLIACKEMEQAEPHLRAALARNPDLVEARAALFHVMDARGDLAGAAAELESVVRQRPDWADALYDYGCALKRLMRLGEAESALRRALAADPAHAPAYRMLGGVLLGQCRTDEALELYRVGRERCPDDLNIESAELFALSSCEQISDDALFERHQAFGRKIEKACPARFVPFANRADPERRLRVGYLSGDFCFHVVTLFTIPVLEHHDRSAVEVYCYSIGGRVDEYTRALSARADVWREAASLSESELAEAIHRDGIDILVDLAGHAGIPQLAVLARQPAPVQVTWLGYLNTTGLTRIQYRISDRYADPPGLTERYHTEALVRLPHSQWCYRPFLSVACAEQPPLERNGHITFGSFNQALKISRSTRKLWAEVLARVPDSRLVVLGIEDGPTRCGLVADLAREGVDLARVRVLPYLSLGEYFQWLNAVDIALDSTPYSGGTTTCDALWMGVPVITVPGSRPASRSAASILTNVGLTEWIAPNAEEYVRRAAEFAGRREALAELRASLRGRMQASPLMDEPGFVRALESAYREMWRTCCGHDGRG